MTERQEVVFIVDDDAAMRRSLVNLIRSVGLRPVAFSSADEFLNAQRPDIPACLVLDVRMPAISGLELQGRLAALGSALPVVFISGHADVPMSVQAMKGGAVEFLTKPFRDQALLDAVHHALDADRKTRKVRSGVEDLRRRFTSLSPRERDVLALVVAGRLNKQIAGELGTSEATVKIHRHNVMAKMAAESLPDLVRMVDRLETLT